MFVLCGISKSSTLQHRLSCGFALVSCKSSWRKAAVCQNEGLPPLTKWKHQDSGQKNRKAKRCLSSVKKTHSLYAIHARSVRPNERQTSEFRTMCQKMAKMWRRIQLPDADLLLLCLTWPSHKHFIRIKV